MPSLKCLLLALLPLASAAATGRRAIKAQNLDKNYLWTVTDWTATTNGSYAFHIAGSYSPGTQPIPAFAAACVGAGIGAPYQPCQVFDDGTAGKRRLVAAHLVGANATGVSLDVSFKFDDLNYAGTYWNYTSDTTQPYGTQASFQIPITEIFGIA